MGVVTCDDDDDVDLMFLCKLADYIIEQITIKYKVSLSLSLLLYSFFWNY